MARRKLNPKKKVQPSRVNDMVAAVVAIIAIVSGIHRLHNTLKPKPVSLQVFHAEGVTVANHSSGPLPNVRVGARVTDLVNGLHFDDLLQDTPDEIRPGSVIAFYDSNDQQCMQRYNAWRFDNIAETRLPSRDQLLTARYDMYSAPRRAWYKWVPELDLAERYNVTECPELVYVQRGCTGFTDWCVREKVGDLSHMGCKNYTDVCKGLTHKFSKRHNPDDDLLKWTFKMFRNDRATHGPVLLSSFLGSYTEQAEWLKSRDWTSSDNHLRNMYLAEAFPAFTKTGYKVMETPKEIQRWLEQFIDTTEPRKEQWDSQSTQMNFVEHKTDFYDLDLVFKQKEDYANRILKPIVEEWSGIKPLELTSFYGVREYHDGNILKNHVDRIDTHILSITMTVRKGKTDGKPWPLEFVDWNGDVVRHDHPAGTMILYESSKLAHGRPYRNQGGSHFGAFVHFKPAVVNFTETKRWDSIATTARAYKESKIDGARYVSTRVIEPENPKYSTVAYGDETKWRGKSPEPKTTTITLENTGEETLDLYWDDGRAGVLQGSLKPKDTITLETYYGHRFFWTKPGKTERLPRSTMEVERGRPSYKYGI